MRRASTPLSKGRSASTPSSTCGCTAASRPVPRGSPASTEGGDYRPTPSVTCHSVDQWQGCRGSAGRRQAPLEHRISPEKEVPHAWQRPAVSDHRHYRRRSRLHRHRRGGYLDRPDPLRTLPDPLRGVAALRTAMTRKSPLADAHSKKAPPSGGAFAHEG